MNRAVLYARVSTRDQKTIPDQLSDLRRYAELKGFNVIGEYQEKESGKRDTRPERQKILMLAWKRRIDVVLVYKLDRWGRSLRDLITSIEDMGNHDVAFVSFSDNLDLTTTNGRMFFHMLCVFAEFERGTTIDRVKAGLEKARARGSRFGRPPTAQRHKAAAIAMRKEGKSQYEIAAALKISRRSVQRLLI